MSYSRALLCASFFFSAITSAAATEIPVPERKPSFQNASIDRASLTEAKHLLEQISLELQAPKEALTQAQTPPLPEQKPVTARTIDNQTYFEVEELEVSKTGDVEMQCGALSKEAMRMRDIIYTTQDIKDSAKMQSHGITAAGAVGSFLIGSVTGGVGLALGGLLLDHNVGKKEDNADSIQDTAEQRRTLMMGIYNAKGCEGPLEHAMQNPEIFDPLGQLASIETASGDNSGEPEYNP